MVTEENRVPRLIAFDLDFTLWDFYLHTITAPLYREGDTVRDKCGISVEFHPDVPKILTEISSFEDTKTALCSRTRASPDLARDALSLIRIPLLDGDSSTAAEFFDETEIYRGSKITHFEELHRKTGIPYTEMLFYDDEQRNSEVESLGVTFVLVQNGLDNETFHKGLTEWRKKHATTPL